MGEKPTLSVLHKDALNQVLQRMQYDRASTHRTSHSDRCIGKLEAAVPHRGAPLGGEDGKPNLASALLTVPEYTQ